MVDGAVHLPQWTTAKESLIDRKADGIEAGIVHGLGWDKFQNHENQYLFVIPETTVKQLAEELARKLESVSGRGSDPAMKVTKVGFSPGAAGFQRQTHALERDGEVCSGEATVLDRRREEMKRQRAEYCGEAGT